MSHYTGGTAVFYLPEFPYSGEVESSNLLMSLELWHHFESIGAVSPKRKTILVTPNNRIISNSDLLNQFYLDKLAQYNVEIRYGEKMISIDKGRISF